jgi:hypothetical protein
MFCCGLHQISAGVSTGSDGVPVGWGRVWFDFMADEDPKPDLDPMHHLVKDGPSAFAVQLLGGRRGTGGRPVVCVVANPYKLLVEFHPSHQVSERGKKFAAAKPECLQPLTKKRICSTRSSNNITKTLPDKPTGEIYPPFYEELQTFWFAAGLHQLFSPKEGACGQCHCRSGVGRKIVR